MAGPNSLANYCLCIVLLLSIAGCSGRDLDTLRSAPLNTDPVVFDEGFGAGVDFQAFLNSDLEALVFDGAVGYQSTSSLRIDVPGPGAFAGGAFVSGARDLTGYDALTFWIRGSAATTLNVAGFANDNTGNSLYQAGVNDIPVTTTWTKVVLPIPLSARLSNEGGLFWFADAVEGSEPVSIWVDDVRFESSGIISNPRPRMATRSVGTFVGGEVEIVGTRTTFSVGGEDLIVEHFPAYFDYVSSNEDVVVAEAGRVRLVGGGEAVVTAKLGAVDVEGELSVSVTVPPSEPAPVPDYAASDVVSLFSNAYNDVQVRTFSADWDVADVTDLRIDGNDVKAYTNLSFAGIEVGTESATVDASEFTHFRMDVWVPAGTFFRIKIVDFGEDGLFGMAPDSEHELTLTTSSTPAIEPGAWATLDIPIEDFAQLRTREHIAQIILSGNVGTVYVDNILFHR